MVVLLLGEETEEPGNSGHRTPKDVVAWPTSTLEQLNACVTDHSTLFLLRLPDVQLLALSHAPPALTFITSIVAALL